MLAALVSVPVHCVSGVGVSNETGAIYGQPLAFTNAGLMQAQPGGKVNGFCGLHSNNMRQLRGETWPVKFLARRNEERRNGWS